MLSKSEPFLSPYFIVAFAHPTLPYFISPCLTVLSVFSHVRLSSKQQGLTIFWLPLPWWVSAGPPAHALWLRGPSVPFGFGLRTIWACLLSRCVRGPFPPQRASVDRVSWFCIPHTPARPWFFMFIWASNTISRDQPFRSLFFWKVRNPFQLQFALIVPFLLRA